MTRPHFPADDAPPHGPGAALGAAARGLILPVLAFSALANLLMLTGPMFMLQVYDRVLASRSEATLVALFGLAAFLYALMVVLDHARSRLVARIGARLARRLERPVFDAAQELQRHRPGDPAARLAVQDLDMLQRWLASPVFLALFDAPWTPLFLGLIFLFHPALGALALAGGVLLVALAALNQACLRGDLAAASVAGLAADRLAEALRIEAPVLAALGMRGAAAGRWSALRAQALGPALRGSDRAGFFAAASKSMRLFLQSAMLALGAWLVLQSQLGPGAMIAASIIMGRALAPVEIAVGQWGGVQAARAGWQRLGRLLAEAPPPSARLPLPRPEGRLGVQDLAIIPPGAAQPVLRDLTFRMPPGRVLGVIGASGAGKSTLARALVGAWPARTGAIRLDGQVLSAFDPDRLGAVIGYLPQRVALFDGTVAENIARLRPDAPPDGVIAAARMAGAHAMIMGLPLGYDTPAGAEGAPLSGGQLQRIGLARALYGDPVLVVLDEPDAHLDREGQLALAAAIRSLKARGATLVIIAHRPATLAECDDLLELDAGRARAHGPRAQILRALDARALEARTRDLAGSAAAGLRPVLAAGGAGS